MARTMSFQGIANTSNGSVTSSAVATPLSSFADASPGENSQLSCSS